MTEQNNLGTSINLLKPFTTSKLTVGISASANRQRENTRTFALTNSFSGLIRLPTDYCDGRVVGLKRNFIVA